MVNGLDGVNPSTEGLRRILLGLLRTCMQGSVYMRLQSFVSFSFLQSLFDLEIYLAQAVHS